jgi:outer membrane protein assembly factor BamD
MRLSLLFVLLFLFSCSQDVDVNSMTAEEHFAYAMELFNDESYLEAEKQFARITIKYSGTPYADDAQFYLAETNFLDEKYLVAASEYSRLVRDMPQSEFVEQAAYKVGLSYYMLSPRKDLDQKYTDKALREYQLFLDDFPTSEYVEEANKKVMELRSKKAEKMLDNAYIYRKLEEYNAALKYIDMLLERYFDTEVVKQALFEKGRVYLDKEDWTMVRDILKKLEIVKADKEREQLNEEYEAAYKEYLEDNPQPSPVVEKQ